MLGPDLGCGPGARPDASRPLERWPYLQSVTDTTATVVWGAGGTGHTGKLLWGEPVRELVGMPDFIQGSDSEPLTLFRATIGGLTPGSTVCYAVEVDGVVRMSGLVLHTAPTDAEAVVDFIALGDMGSGTESQLALRDQIALREGIDLWFTTGDNAYGSGTYSQLQHNAFEVYEGLWHGVPVFPTPGNHEYYTDNAQPYLRNFVLPRNAWRPEDAERYYSTDFGPIHFVGLDSEGAITEVTDGPGDDMVDWLAADLSATTQPWKIAAWHHPPYEGHPSRGPDIATLTKVVPVLERFGVQLVLLGHNHYYERMGPIRDGERSSLAEGGITYVIVGGGGASLYPVEPWPLQEVGISVHSFLVGQASECTLRGEAFDITGASIDAFTLQRCGHDDP